MRSWNLGQGDPLALTLAADFRLCTPDYGNDQIWELEMGAGDPPALSLRTTFGLRARMMRIFPTFHLNGQVLANPADFFAPPTLRGFAPNVLTLGFTPFQGLDVILETWIPDSHTICGRFSFINLTGKNCPLGLELCGQLIPLDGQPLAACSLQSVSLLAGGSANLSPVIFLTGGSQPGQGPYPSLFLDLALERGARRSVTWVQAALSTREESFDHARRTAARPWDAEMARIEIVNEAGMIDIHTGDPDWDATFALSQRTAFGLFLGTGVHLPNPSFVLARQPDHGYSPRGDGGDYGHLWNGQPALEAHYIASLLVGAPELAAGLVRNFLSTQAGNGAIDWKPGLAGQRGRWQSAPLLAELAWEYARRTGDRKFLREVFPKINKSLRHWFDPLHDQDGDGFPEWETPAQSGLEDQPLFSAWDAGSQGGNIACVETPALGAMLSRDLHALAEIAIEIDKPGLAEELLKSSGSLQSLVAESWNPDEGVYHLRDRDSHLCPSGEVLASLTGTGKSSLRRSFEQPTRLLVQITFKGSVTRHPLITLQGRCSKSGQSECLKHENFFWSTGRAVATTQGLFTSLASINIAGLDKGDKVSLKIMDLRGEDISLFLPLWAGMPDEQGARRLIKHLLSDTRHFARPYGVPCTASRSSASAALCQAVHLPWNAFIAEGMLRYGFREAAAELVERLMAGVIGNLKKQHAFYHAFHAETGAGLGERNSINGLAPLGVFLKTLGVEIHSPSRVTLSGQNPFPWPVTVKYRGLAVTRQAEKTVVTFPDGQMLSVDDPTEATLTTA